MSLPAWRSTGEAEVGASLGYRVTPQNRKKDKETERQGRRGRGYCWLGFRVHPWEVQTEFLELSRVGLILDL